MRAGFSITRFVIIHSLEPHEVQTHEVLQDLLSSLLVQYEPTLKVEAFCCSNALEFRRLMRNLSHEAMTNGDRPVLHIDCHGSASEGLEFANGSTLGWKECGELLMELNVSTRFNLLVVLAACYGAYLNSQYSALEPSPAFCIIAPTEEINPADVIGGFRTFYIELLRTGDAGKASSALVKHSISAGQWFSQLAEDWYIELVESYIRNNLGRNSLRIWAKKLSRRMRDSGQVANVGSIRRRLVCMAREELPGKYFDCFFCIAQVPECSHRFSATRARIKNKIETLRASGKYMI